MNFLEAFDDFPDLGDPAYPGTGNIAYALKARVQLLRDMGPALSPFNSFLFLQGLETLPLRMERHSENALAVARFLSEHPAVEWVTYPGLEDHPSDLSLAKRYHYRGLYGALVGFGIKGGAEAGKPFHRLGGALQPPGEHRRRQVAGDSPGEHDAPAARRSSRARPG